MVSYHAGSQGVDSSDEFEKTGVQHLNVSFSGLSAGTTYSAHFVHEDDASIRSNIVTSDGFTTGA